jgi:hypothetical protein
MRGTAGTEPSNNNNKSVYGQRKQARKAAETPHPPKIHPIFFGNTRPEARPSSIAHPPDGAHSLPFASRRPRSLGPIKEKAGRKLPGCRLNSVIMTRWLSRVFDKLPVWGKAIWIILTIAGSAYCIAHYGLLSFLLRMIFSP